MVPDFVFFALNSIVSLVFAKGILAIPLRNELAARLCALLASLGLYFFLHSVVAEKSNLVSGDHFSVYWMMIGLLVLIGGVCLFKRKRTG
jgi:Na+-translocating ferredoxin:NAD+ oxidoreductase RnfD subunit